MKNDVTKTWTDVIAAVKDHHDELVSLGLADPERMRLTIAARRETAKALVDSGASKRQVAKLLGVDEKQIRRDLDADKSRKDADKSRATKAEKRAEREAELAAKQLALPQKRYGVIYADPPWHFEPYSTETGMDRAAENHYPTMTLDNIAALQVPAADDAVLFLWATVPMLCDALHVMNHWGFTYRSHIVWDKIHIGTGYWFRNRHELLLVGIRGNIPAPSMGDQFPSLVSSARKQHSAKPFAFREMIEEMFPTLPRIELFAREKVEGWDVWGNEVTEAELDKAFGVA